MFRLTLEVEGMRCGMCESHVNDVVRKCGNFKKVTSSHLHGETVVISESPIETETVKAAIEGQGYKVGDVRQEEFEKKSWLRRICAKK